MQTPWGDAPLSDAHVHFFSRKFFEALGTPTGRGAPEIATALGWTEPAADARQLAAAWVAELDSHDVARAALIASVPGDEASVIEAVGAFPTRFFGYFMLNPLEEGAAARVREAFQAGLHAVCLFPAMHRYSVNDPLVEPVYQAAAEYPKRAVFVHSGVLTVGVRRKLGLPSPFDMRYSNPIDLHAVALRYPDVPFIVPHFGAGYFREALMLADLCPNVYLDTSSSNSWMRYEGLDIETVFRRALEVAGAKRLLFGTDSSFFPRGWHHAIFDAQTRALAAIGIGIQEASLILGGNLERILW